MSVLNSTVVLPTLQAAGADISVSDHHLLITNCPAMDFRKILNAGQGLVAPVAETLGKITITPATTNSTTYAFILEQDRPDLGTTVSQRVSFTSPASGTTAAMVTAALEAAIIANANFRITTTDGATLVLDAQAGFPAIRATNVSAISANLAIVVTVPYVKSVGTYNDLVRAGVDASLLTSGHTYSQITFEYVDPDAGDYTLGNTVRGLWVIIDVADANYAAFATLMGTTLLAYKPGTTVSDPKALELIS